MKRQHNGRKEGGLLLDPQIEQVIIDQQLPLASPRGGLLAIVYTV